MVSLKTLFPKHSKTAFFEASKASPKARCTANNYKPAEGHAIENQQQSQGSFFAKGSNCIQGQAKVVSSFQTRIKKLSKTAFWGGSKDSPQQGVLQTNINQQEDMQ